MNAQIRLPVIKTGKEACSVCEGLCCKSHPGATEPKHWMSGGGGNELDFDKIEAALLTGRWVIDVSYKDNEMDIYYLRPAMSNSNSIFDIQMRLMKDHCTFLTPLGCELESRYRPYECLSLEPKIRVEPDGPITHLCRHPGDRQYGIEPLLKLWKPHSEDILAMGDLLVELSEAS